MNELIEKIKQIQDLSELPELNTIDPNILFTAILLSKQYHLLRNTHLNIRIDGEAASIKLVETLLKDENELYFLNQYDYKFTKEEKDKLFKLAYEITKSKYSHCLSEFIYNLFDNNEEIEQYISDNEHFFKQLLQDRQKDIPYSIKDKQNFIKLILEGNYIKLINHIGNYSISNLKLLASLVETQPEISKYLGDSNFVQILFKSKNGLEPKEFYELLKLLQHKNKYTTQIDNNGTTTFDILVENNADYLINNNFIQKDIPKCLIESKKFRDECIKRNRYDLAVQCLLPEEFFNDEKIAKNYCKELHISTELYEKIKSYITKYYTRNNNIFHSLIATSLKYKIFTFPEEHYERFINDVDIQIQLAKLNSKELQIINLIIKQYTYEEYDVSHMIYKITSNIRDYQELINDINLEEITKDHLKKLTIILQQPNNQFNIKTHKDLNNYQIIKQEYVQKHIANDNINFSKDLLLKLIFNINLKEALYINNKYCYNRTNENILDKLKESELPKTAFKYLSIINAITEAKTQDEIIELYNYYKDNNIYESEIELEAYLRNIYANLYSQSFYKINSSQQKEQNQIQRKVKYNGQEVNVCIPRDDFRFLIHCLGTCSKPNDSTNTDYQKDWEYFPQLLDHAVACSYINSKRLYDIRNGEVVAYGFDNLEGAALTAMGDCDIDSINLDTSSYDSSYKTMIANGDRARFFVPSLLLESPYRGYNEIVIERRNNPKLQEKALKRTPNYVIMSIDSLDKENLITLNELFNEKLSFIEERDRIEIVKTNNKQAIEKILKKYKNPIFEKAAKLEVKPIILLNKYIAQIMKSKFYDNSLKAASEFNIPLIIIDKEYYFFKELKESTSYDDETKNKIAEFYKQASYDNKKRLYVCITQGQDVRPIISPQETKQSITITA